jgi:hypothetical protein
MRIKFVVVAHHTRRHQAEQLARSLRAHLLIDDGQHGANWNHRRALDWAAGQQCRVVVVEDDALPVHGFVEKVSAWLNDKPDDLISFYLGTGRPPQYQAAIAERLIAADKTRADFITLPQLIHGVCYSVPVAKVTDVLPDGITAPPLIMPWAMHMVARWFIPAGHWLIMLTVNR